MAGEVKGGYMSPELTYGTDKLQQFEIKTTKLELSVKGPWTTMWLEVKHLSRPAFTEPGRFIYHQTLHLEIYMHNNT